MQTCKKDIVERTLKQAGAELGQAQRLGFHIGGLFGFCCQRQARS